MQSCLLGGMVVNTDGLSVGLNLWLLCGFLMSFKKNVYWSIVDNKVVLDSGVRYIRLHTHMYVFFLKRLSPLGRDGVLGRVPCVTK